MDHCAAWRCKAFSGSAKSKLDVDAGLRTRLSIGNVSADCLISHQQHEVEVRSIDCLQDTFEKVAIKAGPNRLKAHFSVAADTTMRSAVNDLSINLTNTKNKEQLKELESKSTLSLLLQCVFCVFRISFNTFPNKPAAETRLFKQAAG